MLENLRRKSLTKTYHDPIHQVHFESGLAKYGSSAEIDVCTQKLSKKLQKSSFETQINKFHRLDIKTYIYFTLNMIYCPKGSFTMGHEKQNNNQPRMEIIERPFLLGETEITQELYQAVMGHNPSQNNEDSQKPVDNVSWYDALIFCNKLSELQNLEKYYQILNPSNRDSGGYDWGTGTIMSANVIRNKNANGYRLPEEKEWEYAAKAGTNNRWAGTDDPNKLAEYAWFNQPELEEGGTSRVVKQLKPNEWGFYDMTGNVDEWCWDERHSRGDSEDDSEDDSEELEHVCKGGYWYGSDIETVLKNASSCFEGTLSYYTGFRICRTVI